MEIKEGKRYWTRCGGISPIIHLSRAPAHSKYPFSDGFNSFDINGCSSMQAETSFDLIAKYTGPELVPPLIPVAGKRYVTKKGWVTPAVARVSDLLVWFKLGEEDCGCSREKLVREYLGKDDPINKETT